jgi:8-oxo-dGTP diphosphatase
MSAEAEWPLSHRVAVGAYVFRDGRMLLLKRTNPPCVFAPPGGKLDLNEDPLSGLHREVLEETGLTIEILGVANVWFGSIENRKPPLLGIDYLARSSSVEVKLSGEHSAFVWAARDDIAAGRVETLTADGYGYNASDLLAAFSAVEKCQT